MTEQVNVDKLDALEKLQKRIPEAKTRKHLGDALDASIAEINKASADISQFNILCEFITDVLVNLEIEDRKNLSILLKSISNIGKNLEEASNSEALDEMKYEVSRSLVSDISHFEQIIRRGWKIKIENAFSSTGRLGDVLCQIPETEKLGVDMRDLYLSANQLAEILKDEKHNSLVFKRLIKERDKITARLESSETGGEVIAFLLAIANQSATLSHITKNVRSWLEQRKALARFKVGL